MANDVLYRTFIIKDRSQLQAGKRLNFTVSESLHAIAGEWDALIPQEHHLRSDHLMVLEKSHINDIEFRYLFIYSGEHEHPVAAIYFQLLHFTSKHYEGPLLKNFLLRPAEQWLMKKGFRILVCGNLFRIDAPGIYFDSRRTALSDILATLQKYYASLERKPHVIMMKDWQSGWDTSWVKAQHYQLWPDDLTMKLSLRPGWKYYRDYEAALKHKYAQRSRKAKSKFKSVISQELSLEEIIQHGDTLEYLYREVVKRQVIRMIIPGKEYFVEMKKEYGGRFKIFGYFLDGQLIAFSSNILHENLWEMHYIGMDYSKNDTLWLYFNLMYDAIERAISMKKSAIELGRTAREAKAVLGGKPVYFTSFIHINSKLVTFLVGMFAGKFNGRVGNNWKSRFPFKEV